MKMCNLKSIQLLKLSDKCSGIKSKIFGSEMLYIRGMKIKMEQLGFVLW